MDRRLIVLLAVTAHLTCYVSADNSPFLTQTVYGFLDFTTTIGNTVMVFSPQSAPPPEPPKTEKSVQENIIETKPPPPSVTSVKPEAIKPSKLSEKDKTNKPAPQVVVSSAVSVIAAPSKKEEKKVNTPKSAVKEQKQIITKVEVVAGPSKIIESGTPKQSSQKSNKQNPSPNNNKNKKSETIKSVTNIVSSKVEVKQSPPSSIVSSKVNSVVQIKASQAEEEPAVLITNNNIAEPEYDFLSRQPSEFVEETYKVINIRPSKTHGPKPKHNNKNRAHQPTPPPDDDDHPLGLVTTLGGTIVKDGLTTVHETSVIGTYISGKYAQVLNSNSKILQPAGLRGKISPTPTHRILKTPAPAISKNHRYNLEPTPSIGDEETSFSKTTRRQTNNGGSFKNRLRSQSSPEPEVHEVTPSSQSKKFKNRNTSHSQRTPSTRFGRPASTPQLATVSVFSETPAPASFSNRRKSSRNSGHKSVVTPPSNTDNQSRRGFKPRPQPTPVEQVTPSASTSIYKFKLNRSPGTGRWQYKTSPKPKVTIRKPTGEDEQQTTPNSNPLLDDLQSNDITIQARSDNDLELSGSQSGPGTLVENDTEDNSIEKPPPVETLKVEISTPADFRDVYYEIATIKSPYTFQVGRVKNTRIITVTSTIERRIEPTAVISQSSLNEPLTENILATASPYGKEHNLLDSSIATLPAITLPSEMETPPLETITETFSTTQNMLKTQILPVVRDVNLTSSLTFIQTYQITRFVTATKTLPPMDFFQFIPSKTLKEFNSRLDEAGSELHLELDFGDSEDEDGVPRRVFPPDLDLANIGSEFDLTEVDKYRVPDNHLRLKKAHGQNKVTEAPAPVTPALTPEQAQQLALLRLLNPAAAAQIPNVVTTSKPILKYETIYESHVIPLFDGRNTIQSTISRPVATITKTEYEIGTSSLPALPLQPVNPLFPQQFSVTSTPVVVNTEVTATDSQILKLTFGAKTVYTTLFSTKVVPTVLTSYVTSSVPVQPSAAGFPGYFPAPFAPFPYVG
ncbi:hypothetical protein K1T71_005205 [Dendrolimus kikuchii]|uniref:Uncharacterized protein n=1 Tax=Dendrolimus kikuchii TaxID=765133 RepID=A0ACC1D6H2_9NEOP|nr:hypothetical protein K1T71_005205 [Dendrolimus kikuchii]